MSGLKDYAEMYEAAGSFEGWDFGDIESRMRTIGEKWDFLELVREHLTTDTALLDIGTGGGEKLLGLAGSVRKAYGIDILEGMIETAKKNQARLNISNVEFRVADSKELPFADSYIGVAMCRHASFHSDEVFRVLKTGGVFLTQQVYARKDKVNIKAVFGRGQGLDRPKRDPPGMSIRELRAAGFKILRDDVYDAVEYYADMSDFIFLLRNTPMIPDFDVEKDRRALEEIEERYMTEYGIKTNSARYLIIARKRSQG